jgi:glycosyltransferase involved in cell wall biosynthesis
LRLLIIDQFSDPGGAQQCLRDLVPEMLRRSWDLTFVAFGNGSLHGDLTRLGVHCEPQAGRNYTNGRKTLRDVVEYSVDLSRVTARIGAIEERLRPDLVYINGPRMLPVSLRLSCPVVFHAHSRLEKRYARMIAATCLHLKRIEVIAASEFAAAPLLTLSPQSRLRVIYTGVHDQGFAMRSLPAKPRIGILGRIAPEKGHLDFVDTARLLLRVAPHLDFAVYGRSMMSESGFEDRVRSAAAGLPIRFAGWTDDPGRALGELDILTVPSNRNEAAGRVVIEALSAGTPVVAYPSGGIRELIRNGSTGLLTRSATPESLAHDITRLLSEPSLRRRLLEEGRREWATRFRLERFQREVCDFMESVALRGRNTSSTTRLVG